MPYKSITTIDSDLIYPNAKNSAPTTTIDLLNKKTKDVVSLKNPNQDLLNFYTTNNIKYIEKVPLNLKGEPDFDIENPTQYGIMGIVGDKSGGRFTLLTDPIKSSEDADKAVQILKSDMSAKTAKSMLTKIGISGALVGLTILSAFTIAGLAGHGPFKNIAIGEKNNRKIAKKLLDKGKIDQAKIHIAKADKSANKKIIKAQKKGNQVEVQKIKSRLGTTNTDFSYENLCKRLDAVQFSLNETKEKYLNF